MVNGRLLELAHHAQRLLVSTRARLAQRGQLLLGVAAQLRFGLDLRAHRRLHLARDLDPFLLGRAHARGHLLAHRVELLFGK